MDQTKRREGTAHIGKNNKFEGFVSKNIRWSNDKKHFWWTFYYQERDAEIFSWHENCKQPTKVLGIDDIVRLKWNYTP